MARESSDRPTSTVPAVAETPSTAKADSPTGTPNDSFTTSSTKSPSFAELPKDRRLTRQVTASIEVLRKGRERGRKMQRRAALAAFGIGVLLFLVGLSTDMLTSEGVLGLPVKAANLFQPVWVGGALFALLAVMPSYQFSQLVIAFFLVVVCPAMAALYAYFAVDTITSICLDASVAANLSTTDGCAMQTYSMSAYAVAGFICTGIVLPSLRRKGGKWVMQPRARLMRLWQAFRVIAALFAANSLPFGIVGIFEEGSDSLGAVANMTAGVCALLLVFLFRPAIRRWMHATIFDKLHVDDKSRAAAMVAAMAGGISSSRALELASANFRVIGFDQLSQEDFDTNETVDGYHVASSEWRTRRVALGACDAFVSHSWRDPSGPKFAQLRAFADAFQTKYDRTPLLWIDKFSINQSNITEGLAALPVNLAGCGRLLCLLGPTYLERIWCLLELHTFSLMGGDAHTLTVLPVSDRYGPGDADVKGACEQALERVNSFHLRHATCYDPTSRTHLLEVIASGCGSHAAFERMLRKILEKALGAREGTRGRRFSFTSQKTGLLPSATKKRRDSKGSIGGWQSELGGVGRVRV